MVRNGIPSYFLFRWKFRKGFPRVLLLLLFRGTEFRVFFSSAKGSEGNFESLLLFLFRGTQFRDVFSSAEGFGTEFREFLFRGTAGIPTEITICSVNSVFRGIIFLSEIPNLTCNWLEKLLIISQLVAKNYQYNTTSLHSTKQADLHLALCIYSIIHMLLSVMTTKKVLPLNNPTAVKSVKHQRRKKNSWGLTVINEFRTTQYPFFSWHTAPWL
jgi:hypothetical protein